MFANCCWGGGGGRRCVGRASPLRCQLIHCSATPPRFSCSTCQFYAVKQGSRNYSFVLSGYLSRHNQPGSHFFSTLLISFKRVFVSTSALPGSALAAAPHWGWWYFRKKSSHSSFVRQNWNCCFLASVVGAKKEYLEFGIVVQIYLPFLWQNVSTVIFLTCANSLHHVEILQFEIHDFMLLTIFSKTINNKNQLNGSVEKLIVFVKIMYYRLVVIVWFLARCRGWCTHSWSAPLSPWTSSCRGSAQVFCSAHRRIWPLLLGPARLISENI